MPAATEPTTTETESKHSQIEQHHQQKDVSTADRTSEPEAERSTPTEPEAGRLADEHKEQPQPREAPENEATPLAAHQQPQQCEQHADTGNAIGCDGSVGAREAQMMDIDEARAEASAPGGEAAEIKPETECLSSSITQHPPDTHTSTCEPNPNADGAVAIQNSEL